MGCASALSALILHEISIKPMVLFQNKNLFLGFAYDSTRKLANSAQACLLSSIASTHKSASMRSTPLKNKSAARARDYLTQVLEKASKTKFIVRVVLVD